MDNLDVHPIPVPGPPLRLQTSLPKRYILAQGSHVWTVQKNARYGVVLLPILITLAFVCYPQLTLDTIALGATGSLNDVPIVFIQIPDQRMIIIAKHNGCGVEARC